jgi:ribose 1,5-bisphosphokinase
MGSGPSEPTAPIAAMARLKLGPGRAIIVVGPSGAGKDTLIGIVKAGLVGRANVAFPKRIVTRASDASEDTVAVSHADYHSALARGELALNWLAHGHGYGYPLAIDDDIARGRTLVLNLSRLVVPTARARYQLAHVVLIDAAPELRRARLLSRQREGAADVDARLARETVFTPGDADSVINNDGDPAEAARALEAIISQPAIGAR